MCEFWQVYINKSSEEYLETLKAEINKRETNGKRPAITGKLEFGSPQVPERTITKSGPLFNLARSKRTLISFSPAGIKSKPFFTR